MSLSDELRDKEYRTAWVRSVFTTGFSFHLRALRLSRGMTQMELAEKAGMSYVTISKMESPGATCSCVGTLLKLAAAFDVGLSVEFVPFSELVKRNDGFSPDEFRVASYEEEADGAD